jgi:hypothetical protein
MQEKPKNESPPAHDPADTSDADEDRSDGAYYYDDAHGYEEYDPNAEPDDDSSD